MPQNDDKMRFKMTLGRTNVIGYLWHHVESMSLDTYNIRSNHCHWKPMTLGRANPIVDNWHSYLTLEQMTLGRTNAIGNYWHYLTLDEVKLGRTNVIRKHWHSYLTLEQMTLSITRYDWHSNLTSHQVWFGRTNVIRNQWLLVEQMSSETNDNW
jgi:hypothetical protein